MVAYLKVIYACLCLVEFWVGFYYLLCVMTFIWEYWVLCWRMGLALTNTSKRLFPADFVCLMSHIVWNLELCLTKFSCEWIIVSFTSQFGYCLRPVSFHPRCNFMAWYVMSVVNMLLYTLRCNVLVSWSSWGWFLY